jgi:nucleotide-binding universal stress UspA family protein
MTLSSAEVSIYYVVGYEEMRALGEEFREKFSWSAAAKRSFFESYESALSRFLEKNFADLLPLVETRKKVEFGRPETSIVEQAKAEGADLIVMCTHGRTGLPHVVMGSVTEKVVRHAPCPVISIHPSWEEKAAERMAAVG